MPLGVSLINNKLLLQLKMHPQSLVTLWIRQFLIHMLHCMQCLWKSRATTTWKIFFNIWTVATKSIMVEQNELQDSTASITEEVESKPKRETTTCIERLVGQNCM